MNGPRKDKKYVGIDKDINGGMTDTGKLIRDAWIFGLIPEEETCEGWPLTGLQNLWEQTSAEWEKYGFLPSNLPPEILERFKRIHDQGIQRAKANGWNPDDEVHEGNA